MFEPILIGMPGVELLAEELFESGFTSCAEAEAAGWFLTSFAPIRQAVDLVLAEKRESQIEKGKARA